jgi:hypothetical protein
MNVFSYTKDAGKGLVAAIHAAPGYGRILTPARGFPGVGSLLGTWPGVALLASLVGFAWNGPSKRRTA